MPSISFEKWTSQRQRALDEIEAAHRSVGGSQRGRRYTTQQINQAFAVLLSSQFQGYCRELHSECADHFVQSVTSLPLRAALHILLVQNRKLDKGNPNPGNLGSDYNRFGLPFWDVIISHDGRNQLRRDALEDLNNWRNAIAHQDFDRKLLGSTVLRLGYVRSWRTACQHLAATFDQVMRLHLLAINGNSPW